MNDVADALIAERADLDWSELRDDTLSALHSLDEVTLSIQDELQSNCGGGGYYRPKPPTIYLHPSILRRDNFTLLHEFGHHLQQRHDDWSMCLLDAGRARVRLEEKVSNAVAQRTLLPSSGGDPEPWNARPADLMLSKFVHYNASRAAVANQVANELGPEARWILAVADREGQVQFARTTYDQAAPARESVQPSFASLATAAAEGPVRRNLSPAIVYNTGTELHNMRADAALDPTGDWVFVALTPVHRFGQGDYVKPTYECAYASCERTFELSHVYQRCEQCNEPLCPTCRRRTCDCGGHYDSYGDEKFLLAYALTIDRIVPGCRGGTYRRNNIRPACAGCNSETGGRTRSKPLVVVV